MFFLASRCIPQILSLLDSQVLSAYLSMRKIQCRTKKKISSKDIEPTAIAFTVKHHPHVSYTRDIFLITSVYLE